MGLTFTDFWNAYPKRKGSRAIAEAEKSFGKAIKKGADAGHIISSARRFHSEAAEQGNIDTPFIPMASTWLNQKRWLDYAPDPETKKEDDAKKDLFMLAKGYIWDGARWAKVETEKAAPV